MGKIILTKEQAAIVETYKLTRELAEKLTDAVKNGYEIESEFKVGDKVMCFNKEGNKSDFCTLESKIIGYRKNLGWWCTDGKASSGIIRHATQEEIYWFETLGREFVGDFREGDVIITNDVSYRYSMDGEIDSIGEHTTKQWAEQGIITKIYPVESSKKYPQKEVE